MWFYLTYPSEPISLFVKCSFAYNSNVLGVCIIIIFSKGDYKSK